MRSADLSRIRLTAGTCLVCGIETEGFASHKSFCSMRCRDDATRYPEGRPKGRDCILCGEWIDFNRVGIGGRRTKVDTYACKTCRRDQRYPVTVHDLAERDGTDCSICKEPVDMTLKWPDRWAPTRDHIIPWSKGGRNEPENFALAHFTCTGQKKNKLDFVYDEATALPKNRSQTAPSTVEWAA